MVIIQIACGPIPDALKPCVESVRRAFPNVSYELIKIPAIEEPILRCVESDRIRFSLARERGEGMAYFDLDVEILKPWKFEPGPHFGFRRGQPGCFAFYGLTTDFLDKMDADMARRNITTYVYCWPAKVMRDMPGIKEIPSGRIKHYAYTLNNGRAA